MDDFCKPLSSSHCDPGAGKSQGQASPSGLLTWLARNVDPRNMPSGLEQHRDPTCPLESLPVPAFAELLSQPSHLPGPRPASGLWREDGAGLTHRLPFSGACSSACFIQRLVWGSWRGGQASRGCRVGGALLSPSCCREVGKVVKDGRSGSRLRRGCSTGRPAVVGRNTLPES